MKFDILKFIILVLTLTLYSCTPDEIEFPEDEEVDPTLFSPSNAIIGLFNEIQQGKRNLESICFEFDYPLSLKTASEVILEIENNDGLNELIESQTSGFFVNQVNFPLSIELEEEEKIIHDELDFQEILSACDLESLPLLFSFLGEECFDFEYPITVTFDLTDTQEVSSLESFLDLIEDQEEYFLLQVAYPIQTTSDQTIQNDFELYQKLNECQSCPDISFGEFQSDDEVTIRASVERIEEVESFSWTINDQLFEEDGNILMNDFSINVTDIVDAPGTFEICLNVEYKYCDNLLSFCDEIVIEEKCPEEFEFQSEQSSIEDDSAFYHFEIADFEPEENSQVRWYVNDELVQSGPSESTLTLERGFVNGTYNVCAEYFSDFCLQNIEFCERIEVDIPEEVSTCPNLFFVVENQSDNTYLFVADFNGIEELEWYAWSVNDVFLEDDGIMNDGDNRFEFTFNEPTIHTVCIFTETPDCPEGAEYCLEIDTRE